MHVCDVIIHLEVCLPFFLHIGVMIAKETQNNSQQAACGYRRCHLTLQHEGAQGLMLTG